MGVRNDDDNIIPRDPACVCIGVSGSDSRVDAEGKNEPEIFFDLVSGRCGIARMCDFSTDDPVFHTSVRRVFGNKRGVLHRRVLPCSDRPFADIDCVRPDRENPEACAVAGNS